MAVGRRISRVRTHSRRFRGAWFVVSGCLLALTVTGVVQAAVPVAGVSDYTAIGLPGSGKASTPVTNRLLNLQARLDAARGLKPLKATDAGQVQAYALTSSLLNSGLYGSLVQRLPGSSTGRPLGAALVLRSAAPLATANQGYPDPIGDSEAGLAPDIAAVAVVNDASGYIGFGVFYANRVCAGGGDFIAIFLDVDQNSATGSSGGAEYAVFLDGTTRTAGVGQWNGSTWTISFAAAGACSTTTSPPFDVIAVSAASVGITSGFNFTVVAGWSAGAGAPSYADVAGPFSYSLGGAPAPPAPTVPSPPPPPATPATEPPPPPNGRTLATHRGPTANSRNDPDYTRTSWEISRKTKATYCWNTNDWGILAPDPEPGVFITGFVLKSRPQEVNISPAMCARLDLIHYLKKRPAPTAWLANGVDTLSHESLHVRGFRSEAVTECVAMQITASTAQLLGTGEAYGRALAAKLWNNYLVSNKPIGYWSSNCHNGGPWDIDHKSSSWPTP